MNIETVNELIATLESAGELSIREQKFLKLAKAYQQLAAENVALKNVFGPGDAVLNFLTIALRHTTYDQIDLDDVSLAFKMSLPETPSTDRIVAGIKADGVEEFAKHCDDSIGLVEPEDEELYTLMEERAREFAEQLREGPNMSDITELAQSLKHRVCDGLYVKEDDILKLVDALEKAQKSNEFLKGQLSELANFNPDWDKLEASYESWREIAAELLVAKDRIAELESRTVTAAAADVLAERQRQVTAEGWTAAHDDEYQHCEMAVAAACYIMADDDPRADVPELWPWPSEWWKPTNIRRDLVKAGALILAEIERLDRAAGIKVEAE